jgi:hypothetical protein
MENHSPIHIFLPPLFLDQWVDSIVTEDYLELLQKLRHMAYSDPPTPYLKACTDAGQTKENKVKLDSEETLKLPSFEETLKLLDTKEYESAPPLSVKRVQGDSKESLTFPVPVDRSDTGKLPKIHKSERKINKDKSGTNREEIMPPRPETPLQAWAKEPVVEAVWSNCKSHQWYAARQPVHNHNVSSLSIITLLLLCP